MRKNKRLYCSGFSIAFLLLSIIAQNGQNTNESDLSDYIQKDRYSIICPVKPLFIAYKNIDSTSYLFSNYYGYFYYSNNEYVSTKFNIDSDESIINTPLFGKHYDGQDPDSVGCGNIIDTNLYVASKYGTGWTLEKSNSLSMDSYTQYGLSCYLENKIKKDKTGVEYPDQYSEGSCWFVSAFHILRYMQKTKWTKMPDKGTKISYNPSVQEPNLYHKFFDESGKNKTEKLYYNNKTSFVYKRELRSTNIKFEQLYADVRTVVNDKFKKVDGGTVSETAAIIERVAKKYGYNVDARENPAWAVSIGDGTASINSSKPFLWSTSCDTYGSHAMAVCGYKRYTKTTGWWIFKSEESKLFFELRDGWSTSARYFDISGYVGFGAFITLHF